MTGSRLQDVQNNTATPSQPLPKALKADYVPDIILPLFRDFGLYQVILLLSLKEKAF